MHKTFDSVLAGTLAGVFCRPTSENTESL
jgi:hypothetical protein